MLARLVKLVTALVVGVIVIGIVLHLFDANAGNALVGAIYDVAGWLVTPFKGLFSVDPQKAQIALNWGIGALVYAIVGGVIASLLARAAIRSGGGYSRRPGPVG